MKRLSVLATALLLVLTFTGRSVRSQAQSAPILLVVNSAAANPFGPYLGEILLAEGINTFSVAQLSDVTATSLADVKLVVLAETGLNDTQATTLSNFVAGGGRLVAMRPDGRLASTLGITRLGTTTGNGYIRINDAGGIGTGFTTTTLPYKGIADNYSVGAGGSALATIFSSQSTATSFPAVVVSGRTATWAYDLARSVAYTRQGDPANAGLDRDGLTPLRTNDIFYNTIDKDRVSIPHADMQMRLLARVIGDLLATTVPLPTLWYFPNAAKTLLVVTADSHANPQQWFDDEVAAFNARGVKASIYINGGSSPSVSSVESWRAQGHEVGMHPTGNQAGKTLNQAYIDNTNYFLSNGYGTPSSTTRNHQLEWLGWVDAAKVAANYGIAMDTSFYTWGPAVTYPDGHQAHGYINGSGQLMRFVDQNGAIVPVWQLVTSLVDEQLIVNDFSEHMTGDQALAVSRQLIDASQAGDYAAIMTQFHVDYYGWGDVQTWANGTMDYANGLNIPNRTSEAFLRYTTDRAGTGVAGLAWNAGTRQLTFTVDVPAGGATQTVTVPTSFDGNTIANVRVNGAIVSVTNQTITGRSLSMFSVAPTAGGASVVVTYAGGAPTLSIADASVTEGTGGTTNATFTISLSPAAAVPVTVNYATGDGTATAPSDYTATSDSVTFAAGATSRTVSVPIVTDSVNEPDETFTVTLSNATNAAIADGTAIGTILNDDAPSPSLTIGDVSTLEGSSGNHAVTLTVTLAPTSSQTVTVNWTTQNGTAESGSDFVAGAGSLSFAPGASTRTLSVSVTGDSSIEQDETFTVTLSGSVGAQITDGSATVTILNDDTVPSVATFVRTTRNDFACAVLNNTILTQAADGEVRLGGAFGDEYTAAALGSQWTARTWTGATYTPTISGGILSIGSATGAFVRSTATQTVGVLDSRAEFTASQWEHIGWGDVDFANKYLIFSTFNTTNTLFARSNTGAGEQNTNLGPIPNGNHTYHIERVNQGATDEIRYSIDGTVVATHTVNALTEALHVFQSTNGGATPTLNVDNLWTYPPYVSSGTFESCSLDAGSTVTWTTATWAAQSAAGTTLGVRTRTSNDNASWSAWAPVGASGQAIASPPGRYLQYGLDLDSTSTNTSPVLESITIGFGTSGTPTLSVSDVSVPEGQTGNSNAVFTVTLSGSSTQTVTVNYATSDGTATAGGDYVATSGPLTFAPGETSKTVTVPVIGDTVNEPNETFQVTLNSAVNANIGSSGTGTILNDDAVPTVSIANTAVTEGNSGTVNATFVVTLSSPTSATATVNFATANGTATAGSDYTAASGTVTFAPGTTTQNVTIAVIPDTLFEPNETFVVNLTAPSNAVLGTAQATGTINNDDGAPSFSINNVSVTELNSSSVTAAFTVTLSAAPAANATVDYASSDVTASAVSDYTGVSGTLTFTPTGPLTQTVSVSVLGDTLYEANETFRVTLSNPTNAVLGTAQGTGTINNNDTAPSISTANVSVTEGNSGTTNATFILNLSAASGVAATVNFATSSTGSTATAGADYTATSVVVTFPIGSTTQSVNVPIVGDTLSETNETFQVNLTGATNATIATAQVIGTILNDDTTVPSISIADASLADPNNGNAPMSFTVTLSAVSSVNVTVNYQTASGTASSGGGGSDFNSASGTLTIPAGSQTGSISVTIRGDTTPEADETFVVNLSNPVNATIADGQATGTIINNDGSVTVSVPNTAVTWPIGASRTITWATSGFGSGGSTFRIELSRDGGTNWTVLAPSVSTNSSGNGSFNWTVTGPATTQGRIRVTWTGNSAVTDVSNTNFTIQ